MWTGGIVSGVQQLTVGWERDKSWMKLRFLVLIVHKEGLENAEVISDGASREIFLEKVSFEQGLKEGIGAGCVREGRKALQAEEMGLENCRPTCGSGSLLSPEVEN